MRNYWMIGPYDREPEDIPWNQGCFDDGAEARIVYGAALSDAPSAEQIGKFAHDSWVAGWSDADQALRTIAEDQTYIEE